MTEKLYTVSELGRDLTVTPRAIRFYEDKGLITPQRAGTTRVYGHRDRARMVLILRGKHLGFSLSEIKRYLDLYDADVTHRAQQLLLRDRVVDRLRKLERQREAIDQTIAELNDIRAQLQAVLDDEAPRRAAD